MSSLKVFGPPGTGKTTFLLNSLEEELRRVKPYRIAFLTFTRSARVEALQRAKMSEKELPYLRTIHSICYKQVGVSQSQMIKPKMLKEFGDRIGTEITGWVSNPFDEDPVGGGGKKMTRADILLNLNHLGRHRKVGLRQMLQTANEELDWEFSKWFTETYRKWKDAESLFDFTDLLSVYLQHGNPLNIDVMFVDEAQDLSRLQWDVVHKLGANARRIIMAGDDDQAIFTWAGASAGAFIDEPSDEQRILDQSNRCPRAVMRVADSIIGNVRRRVAKNVRPRDAEGSYETYGYLDQSLFDGPASKFLLYRNHHRGLKLSQELEDLAIPYASHMSPLTDKDVSNAVQALAKSVKGILATPGELRSFMDMCDARLLKKESEELAEKPGLASQLLKNEAETDVFKILARLPKKDYIRRCIELHGVADTFKPKVLLQSIHQSKGQEAHTVVLDTELAKKTFDGMMDNPDDEHRVWYVGATRAKEKLVVLLPTNQLHYQI